MADAQLFQPHGKALFQHFRIGHPGVGHVALHRIAAVKARPGPGAAADRLIVLEPVVAPDEVVHRALRRRHHPQRAVQRVAGGLADLGIARDHRRRRARVQQAAFGQHDRQRPQAAFVQRDRFADQGAENVKHNRPRHCGRGVVIAGMLRAGAGEVDRGLAPRAVDPHRDPNGRSDIHRTGERSVLQPADHAAHAVLGVLLDMRHIGLHHIQPMRRRHAQ